MGDPGKIRGTLWDDEFFWGFQRNENAAAIMWVLWICLHI